MWKIIPETNNLYEISDTGFIKRVPGTVSISKDGSKTRSVGGNILKHKIKKNGYCEVVLRVNKKSITCYVHRLVAKTFLNLDRESKLEVNHKDKNKTNNNLNNLELVSHSENLKHAGLYGVTHHAAKVNEYIVKDIRKIGYKKSKDKYPLLSRGCIDGILNRTSWKHI